MIGQVVSQTNCRSCGPIPELLGERTPFQLHLKGVSRLFKDLLSSHVVALPAVIEGLSLPKDVICPRCPGLMIGRKYV